MNTNIWKNLLPVTARRFLRLISLVRLFLDYAFLSWISRISFNGGRLVLGLCRLLDLDACMSHQLMWPNVSVIWFCSGFGMLILIFYTKMVIVIMFVTVLGIPIIFCFLSLEGNTLATYKLIESRRCVV